MQSTKLALLVPLAVVLSCAPPDGESEEEVGTNESEIINGTLDTTHPSAVAYMQGGNKVCSASIIQRSGSTGYALTAAHCLGGSLGALREGQNHNSGYIEYPVVEATPHPFYGYSPLFDFAMLRFTNAGASSAVTPAMTPGEDALAPGQQVQVVGFGQTESGPTSQRRIRTMTIDDVTELQIGYDQTAGGICFGDSGGPGYRTIAAGERVAGVHRAVQDANMNGDCIEYAYDARISAVYDEFVVPFINDTGFLPPSCSQCTEGVLAAGGYCQGAVADCYFNNSQCNDFIDCYYGCGNSSCEEQCGNTNPSGLAAYHAALKYEYDCLCEIPCATICDGNDGVCATCGVAFADDECNGCAESACCAQLEACNDDAECWFDGQTGDWSPSGASGARDGMFDCLNANCASECGLPGTGGAGGTGGTGGETNTGTGTDPGTGTGTSTDTTTMTGTGAAPGTQTVVVTVTVANTETTSNNSNADEDGSCNVKSPGGRSGSERGSRDVLFGGLLLALVGLARAAARRLPRRR